MGRILVDSAAVLRPVTSVSSSSPSVSFSSLPVFSVDQRSVTAAADVVTLSPFTDAQLAILRFSDT